MSARQRRHNGRRLAQFVGRLDDDEDCKGNEEKVQNGLNEGAILDCCAAEGESQTAEVDPADDQTDYWHDNIAHQRCDDFSKCAADDYRDGQVQHIAAHDELFEFF